MSDNAMQKKPRYDPYGLDRVLFAAVERAARDAHIQGHTDDTGQYFRSKDRAGAIEWLKDQMPRIVSSYCPNVDIPECWHPDLVRPLIYRADVRQEAQS